jgi:hypothetical protein
MFVIDETLPNKENFLKMQFPSIKFPPLHMVELFFLKKDIIMYLLF